MTLSEQYRQKKLELKRWYAGRIVELFGTMTLAEIAANEGMSLSNVNMLIRWWHIDQVVPRKPRTALVATDRSANRDGHAQRIFGCSWNEVQLLTGLKSFHGSRSHPLLKMWWHHRNTATRSKTSWEITLPQYATLVSPYIGQFGRFKGAKVLGRIDKRLPWHMDNVHVTTLEENSYRTKGYAKAFKFIADRTQRRAKKAAELQASGLSLMEVARRLRVSKARVNHYLQIARQA